MNLLYIIIGKEINLHLQTSFSIYSFLAQQSEPDTVNVITDEPGFYHHLKDHVNLIPIDAETLKEWKGKHDFFWRVKLKGIEMTCALYPNSPVVYLDTDTFLYGHIDDLRKILSDYSAIMYEREFPLSEAKTKTGKRMWAGVKNKVFGGMKILPSHYMWNSGVVGTPNNKDGDECRLSLAICDEMCDKQITKYFIEQFSLSVSLHEIYGLTEGQNIIAHYWSNKDEWTREILTFFTRAYFMGLTTDENIRLLKNYDFKKIAVKKKTPSIKRKVSGLMGKLFPDKNFSFTGDR